METTGLNPRGSSFPRSMSHVIPDTPSCVNFLGEVAAAIELADGVPFIIDVLEGVCLHQ